MSILFGSTGKSQSDEEFEVSAESATLIVEAMLLEHMGSDEIESFITNHTEVNASYQDEVLLERSIVRLDKAARISHAQKIAIFAIAREKKDPMFSKLLTVWRMERYLENYLGKKYGAQAMRVARQNVNRGAQSASKAIKTAADRAKKQFSTPLRPTMTNGRPNMPSMTIPSSIR